MTTKNRDISDAWRSSSGSLPDPGDVRVMIVEDEWLIAIEIQSMLEHAGYNVVGIAVSAEEALDIAQRCKPHIATMDVRLLGPMDGVDTALKLHATYGLRCLFISAYTGKDILARAAAAKPLGLVQKPFFISDLKRAMEAALSGLANDPKTPPENAKR